MPWMEPELEFIKRNASDNTVKNLAAALAPLSEQLNSSFKSDENVRARLKTLNLKARIDRYHYWSQDDIDFLEANRSKMSVSAMAKKLGYSRRAVKAKYDAKPVGLQNMEKVSPWMPNMLEKVEEGPYSGKSLYDIQLELYEAGRKVEIRERGREMRKNKLMAVFSR